MKSIQEMSSIELVNHRNYLRELNDKCEDFIKFIKRGESGKLADEKMLDYIHQRVINTQSKCRQYMNEINLHIADIRDHKSETCTHPTFTEIKTSNEDSIFECTECGYLTHTLPEGSKCTSTDWKL